jgi:hypothetical protein
MTRGGEAQLHYRSSRAVNGRRAAKRPLRVRPVVLGLVSGFAAAALTSPGFADTIDPRLIGAWTASAADCQKFFERRDGKLTYRQPVDQFAQAVIIEPGQIRAPTGACRIRSVAHDKNGAAVSLDCHDSISFQSETVHFKILNGAEIVYSPTGDPSLDTTYQKCRL